MRTHYWLYFEDGKPIFRFNHTHNLNENIDQVYSFIKENKKYSFVKGNKEYNTYFVTITTDREDVENIKKLLSDKLTENIKFIIDSKQQEIEIIKKNHSVLLRQEKLKRILNI